MAKIMRVMRKRGIIFEIPGSVHVYIPEEMTGTVLGVYRDRIEDGPEGDDITVQWDHALHSKWSEEGQPENWIAPWEDGMMMSKDLRFIGFEESADEPA